MFHSQETSEFRKESVPPFNEMMISWNGPRPLKGKLEVYARVFLDDWTPWLLYSSWEANAQSSFHTQEGFSRVYQDAFEVLEGKKATGFHIRLNLPMRLHVYTNGSVQSSENLSFSPLYLKLEGLSQMTLDHPRHRSLCSPTSVAAVLRYLLKKPIHPLQIAERVWDRGFDIYGNWVFNVAEGVSCLGPSWNGWVEKLSGFSDLYRKLTSGIPVIVSVRGPLPGSREPYAQGHLLVVTGFDPEKKEVCCMDPAFPSDEATHVRYLLDPFLAAWARRGNVAYLFEKTS